MLEKLETTLTETDIRKCGWCGVKYDYKKRQEEIKAQQKKDSCC